jgi:hypothetical protein
MGALGFETRRPFQFRDTHIRMRTLYPHRHLRRSANLEAFCQHVPRR